MISYIKTINQERRNLSRRKRIQFDILVSVSVFSGGLLAIEIFERWFIKFVVVDLELSIPLIVGSCLLLFLACISTSQLVFLGLYGFVFFAKQEITSRELIRYVWSCRQPQKWQNGESS